MKKVIILLITVLVSVTSSKGWYTTSSKTVYSLSNIAVEKRDTLQELVAFVKAAAQLICSKGEAAFKTLSVAGSRWRHGDKYIFVIDEQGTMLVHADPALVGRNQLDLKDINGKLIVRGLIETTTQNPQKPEGWFHYEWPVPGGLLPRWKSSFVERVKAPSGKVYIVGSGMYNDQMEREFVIDIVNAAVAKLEKNGKQAFPEFYDPKGPFIAKDAYVFVIDSTGIELVNPVFKNLQGRNLIDLKDTRGKQLVREMFQLVQTSDSGWVDYMWPKPGESVSTQKSAYVKRAKIGADWLLVGCGVYLADAPKATLAEKKMSAAQLVNLVQDAAKLFAQKGEQAFPEFRQKGSKWFRDDTYFFVWSLEGIRIFHAANPAGEGENMSSVTDVIGRPWGKMFLDAVTGSKSEACVHYMYPEPGEIFPTWKSSFLKRVKFPSGKDYLVGCGIYNMQMDKAFIQDVLNRACDLIRLKGRNAFAEIRDKKGAFNFMDTYVFVDDVTGVELVNPAQPSLEGKNIMNVKDAHGNFLVRNYITTALKKESAWVDYYWYKPGQNTVAHKHTYVRKASFGKETFIVGAGFYANDEVQAVAKNSE